MSLPYPLDDTYQMIYAFQEDFGLWILLFAVIFGFVLSFAVGANDSANSWGTPVGAGTVSFGVAVLFGAVMETLGAMVLSAGVVNTVAGSSSVVNMELYHSNNETEWDNFKAGRSYLEGEKELMLGMLSSMLASRPVARFGWQHGQVGRRVCRQAGSPAAGFVGRLAGR